MGKKHCKDYLELLRTSLDYIGFCEKERTANLENKNIKNQLDYHIFSFSQLVYAIYEGLKKEFSCKSAIIDEVFFDEEKPVYLFFKLANEWKHKERMETRQEWTSTLPSPESMNVINGLKMGFIIMNKPTVKLPSGHSLNKKDAPLILEAKEALDLIDVLLKKISEESQTDG